MKFSDIRQRIEQAAEVPGPLWAEMADTLRLLEQMESDFATLCREVASLSVDHNIKSFSLSGEFYKMINRREIELPEIY